MKIRKIIIAICCAAIMLPAMMSCKKGPNDPAISLKSRTARLTGEWTVSAALRSFTSGTTTNSISYDDGVAIATIGGTTQTGTYRWDYTINKDGTWETEYSETFGGVTYTNKSEGTWFWAGANKDEDVKNKQMLMFRLTREVITNGGTTDTYTYSGDDLIGYMVDKLSSKEVVLIYENIYTSTATETYKEEITLIP